MSGFPKINLTKFQWKCYTTKYRKIWIARITLKKKIYEALPALPDIKIHYKTSEINALVWQWSINRESNQKDSMESTWINSSMYGNLVYNKGGI